MKREYEIRQIEFRYIQNPDALQQKFVELLDFPDFYGRNWDAFWDAITGIVEMPDNVILYDIQDYERRFPDDAKKLILLQFDYNKEVSKPLFLLDQTEELFKPENQTTTDLLFKERPAQWGLRGDPHLWNDLEAHFSAMKIPESEDELIKEIHDAIFELTGSSLATNKTFYVKKYDTGGMSKGRVSSGFWLEKGIPMLIGRFRLLKG